MTIGENGGVIAFQTFIDEVIDLALLIEVLLRSSLVEDIVEVEVFGGMTVVDLNLIALRMTTDAGVLVSVFDFVFEEGTDPNGCFYLAAHE